MLSQGKSQRITNSGNRRMFFDSNLVRNRDTSLYFPPRRRKIEAPAEAEPCDLLFLEKIDQNFFLFNF